VSDACKNSTATNIKVKELYHNFSSFNQHYIDQLLLEHQYVFVIHKIQCMVEVKSYNDKLLCLVTKFMTLAFSKTTVLIARILR